MNDDALYDEFVERYFETGVAQIPDSWTEDLRLRCRYFLRMVESRVGEALPAAAPAPRETELVFEPQVRGSQAPRYVVDREIGRGGMGRILLAYDQDFRRQVAVKVAMHPPEDTQRTARFLEEAQATAQLEHPNIAPVYDLGVENSGRPYFTMKWIRGRDLQQIIAGGSELSLTRLVQVLQQAAMGVHFAHTRGVIHRDLKPQNIMVGDFGEVLVVDWGLAKVLTSLPAATDATSPISTERSDGGQSTLDGIVQGSLAYMAPEQARGDAAFIDSRTDVWGLGTILYEILTGAPLRPVASFQALLQTAKRGEVIRPRDRASERTIPPALEAACLRALAPRQEDRFPSAKDFHDTLQAYIEGIHDAQRRAQEAARLRQLADAAREELKVAERAAQEASSSAKSQRSSLPDHASEADKAELWRLTSRFRELRSEAGEAFNRTTAAYRAVLGIDATDRAARRSLAEIYLARLEQAEDRGDCEATALYKGLVAQYDDGRLTIELEGKGRLLVHSDPPGARVLLSRHEEHGPFLEAGAATEVGQTPLEIPLACGSYLVRLVREGFEDVRLPLVIDRSGSAKLEVRLCVAGTIARGFVQVPGGLTIVGGDTEAYPARPRAQLLVGEVFVGTLPVTLGEYCEFLSGSFEPSLAVAPEHLPSFGRQDYVERKADGTFAPIARLEPTLPVFGVTFDSIQLYCQWLARRLARPIRLLTEVEWERAARGADGRVFPWGNGFDWVLMKGGLSRPGEPTPEPVGAFARDVSPFGVRDLAGGIRENVDGWYGKGYRLCKGGSWFNPVPFIFRADCRTSLRDLNRATDVGFRVCYGER